MKSVGDSRDSREMGNAESRESRRWMARRASRVAFPRRIVESATFVGSDRATAARGVTRSEGGFRLRFPRLAGDRKVFAHSSRSFVRFSPRHVARRRGCIDECTMEGINVLLRGAVARE